MIKVKITIVADLVLVMLAVLAVVMVLMALTLAQCRYRRQYPPPGMTSIRPLSLIHI